MATDDPLDDPEDLVPLDAPRADRERDGVGALRDIDAEAGDEDEVQDLFDLDKVEARELGGDLDASPEDEIELD